MHVETFNACVFLAGRQVEAARGGHLAVTGKIQRGVVREVAARRPGRPGT